MPVELQGSCWAKNSLLKKNIKDGLILDYYQNDGRVYIITKSSELLGIWIWIYVLIALELVSLAPVSWVQVLLSDWTEAGHELLIASQLRFSSFFVFSFIIYFWLPIQKKSQLRFSDFWLWNLILVFVFHNAIGFNQNPTATIKCVGNLKILRCQSCMNLTRIGIGYCYK